MLIPPTPFDENDRLQALTSLGILDTLPEERFDRITRVVWRVFNVPIALVSLVDRERQWFKSRQGLDATGTPRQVSFCGHAILQPGPLVIPDTQFDTRFSDNPLVCGSPHIRFYAGHPIHAPDGARIGTLCIIDQKPRILSDTDLGMLRDFASMVDRELELVERSTTDELTRLSNRRGFITIGAHVLALCRRTGRPAAVVTIDLDNFKSVNDRDGHDAGDAALRTFGRMLFTHFRGSDVVARLGGDEFAVPCAGVGADDLANPLERLRSEFSQSKLARQHPQLSWSAGLASLEPTSRESLETLLRIADADMYRQKAEHRRSRVAGERPL